MGMVVTTTSNEIRQGIESNLSKKRSCNSLNHKVAKETEINRRNSFTLSFLLKVNLLWPNKEIETAKQ